ncbi:MAG: pirin family protein [Caulobacteraceae bacterium]|nr:MAG: pirin family protein [Caulobacteraceae bacterium]
MAHKSVLALHTARRDDIGNLATRRPLPNPALEQVDPFLFLNHHGPQFFLPQNTGLPFAPHPHRGFETVSFIVAGEMAHVDSAGHESVIRAGGVQWMTAGSGLVHAEVSPKSFKEDGGRLEILQLWVNLPSALKMTQPRYVGLQAEDIPVHRSDDDRARLYLVSGRYGDTVGPIDSLTGVFMSVLDLAGGGRMHFDGLAGRNVFLYVINGDIRIGGREVPRWTLVTLDLDGDHLEIEGLPEATMLFGHADPIGEPVVAHGPFVMNTVEEINQAVTDHMNGKFGSVRL